MKALLLIVLAALFCAACAGQAARARDAANEYRDQLNDVAGQVTELGRLIGLYCSYAPRLGDEANRRAALKMCDSMADLYDGVRVAFKPARLAIDAYEAAATVGADIDREAAHVQRLISRVRQLAIELARRVTEIEREVARVPR